MSHGPQTAPPLLMVLSNVRVRLVDDEHVELPRKFRDGAAAYAGHWPGKVEVLLEARQASDHAIDNEVYRRDELPFAVTTTDYMSDAVENHIKRASVMVVGIGDRKLKLADRAERLGVPLVFVTEYTLATRRQIVRLGTSNPLLRWRRDLWTWLYERRCVRAIRKAAGIQCNGLPTWHAYRDLSPKPLLFFDTRIRDDMIVDDSTLQRRLDEMSQGGPLRLLFSGRLLRMKGVDHLPRVAAELTRRGVDFRMEIFGGGELEQTVAEQIRSLGVEGHVIMKGVVKFREELVPHVMRHADLFVCCHPQGDPSCTYLETMACGVPIAGYPNEAWAGLRDEAGVGYVSERFTPESLADCIAACEKDRHALAEAAWRSREFAAANTFDKAFASRIAHLLDCAGLDDAKGASTTTDDDCNTVFSADAKHRM